MPLMTTKPMFDLAYDGGFAVGAFNVNNMEQIQAIMAAAKETKSPVDHALFWLSKVNVKVVIAAGGVLVVVVVVGIAHWAWHQRKGADPLANLQPAVYQPASSGDTLPLPKK